jgi:hypothetical protein
MSLSPSGRCNIFDRYEKSLPSPLACVIIAVTQDGLYLESQV